MVKCAVDMVKLIIAFLYVVASYSKHKRWILRGGGLMTKSDLFQFVWKCRDIINSLRPMENTGTLPLTPFAIMSQNVNRIAADAELTYLKT